MIKETLASLLLLYMFSTYASLATSDSTIIKSNLEKQVESFIFRPKYIAKKSQEELIYDEYVEKSNVISTKTNIALNNLDKTKPGTFVSTNNKGVILYYVDGLGLGSANGVIDGISKNPDMFMHAKDLENFHQEYFNRGFAQDNQYFMEALQKYQNQLTEFINEANEKNMDINLSKKEEGYTLTTEKLFILLHSEGMTVKHADNIMTSIMYNLAITPDYLKLYEAVKNYRKK